MPKETKTISDTSLEMTYHWGDALHMEEGLVLTNHIADDSSPQAPARLNFIMMALCTQGEAHYSIDTRDQMVKPGDLLFVSDRHILDKYKLSPDFECQCILVSTSFYHSFVQNVKNVSSLLLFSMNNPVVSLTPREIHTYSAYYHTIREKMADRQHHYRTDLIKKVLLAMFYVMSNVIYRVEQQGQKAQTRADAFFAQFIKLLE